MKILITGSNGLLGQKLIHKLRNSKFIQLIATSIGENRITIKDGYKYLSLDITDSNRVNEIILSEKPDVIINTAAMTNVDVCEEKKTECNDINVNSVKYLSNCAEKIDSHLIHISTDFIFDGIKGPYSESDIPNPLSHYGLSKLKSENVLMESNCKWTILRTIVLYGVGEKLSKENIVIWAKGVLHRGGDLNIVDDQFRSPTLAEDLADACILAFQKKKYGIFNTSGKDFMSIYEMVYRIATFYHYPTKNIKKISTKMLNQKAERPARTGFIIEKAIRDLGFNPHSFEECLSIIDKQLN